MGSTHERRKSISCWRQPTFQDVGPLRRGRPAPRRGAFSQRRTDEATLMLWKRARTDDSSAEATVRGSLTDPPTPLPTPSRDSSQEDHAIDTVVSMLRTLGRQPLGLGDVNPAES